MDSYVTGTMIKQLREKKNLTQKELSERLMVSEKTISKWETKRGLPDISMLETISKVLDVSLLELFNGELIENKNKCANVLKTKFYVCPICGNVITSLGEISGTCCGRELLLQEAEEDENLIISDIGGELYICIDSPMYKNDYISFIAYLTFDKINIVKLYPEQSPEVTFIKAGHGYIYYYDIRNGLFRKKI